MDACTHDHAVEFLAAEITKSIDGRVVIRTRAVCFDCRAPVNFKGLNIGMNFDSPHVSDDGTELRIPIGFGVVSDPKSIAMKYGVDPFEIDGSPAQVAPGAAE